MHDMVKVQDTIDIKQSVVAAKQESPALPADNKVPRGVGSRFVDAKVRREERRRCRVGDPSRSVHAV